MKNIFFFLNLHLKLVTICFILCNAYLFCQVGIGTTSPKSTIHVEGTPTDPTIIDGVIPPRLTGNQLQAKAYTAAQVGTVVYITEKPSLPKGSTLEITVPGFYQFNGSLWKRLITTNDASEGVNDDQVDLVSTTDVTLGSGESLITYDTDVKNTNNWYDKTTGRFQPQKAGLWLVTSGYYTYAGASGNLNYLFYKKNGTENIARSGGYKATVNKIAEVIYFNGTTDYIEVYANKTTSSTSTVSVLNSFFSAGYLGGTPSSSTFEMTTSHVGSNSNTIGDIKEALMNKDHEGWIILDGRAISTLTSTQQVEAANLGFATNLPDATGVYLSQNGTTLGTISGSNDKYLVRSDLPPIQIPLTSDTAGSHTHTYRVYRITDGALDTLGGTKRSAYFANELTDEGGEHSHTGTTNYLHSDTSTDTQQPMETRPLTFNVNTFIYLGQ